MSFADCLVVDCVAYICGCSTQLGNNVRVTRVPVTEQLFEVLGLNLAAGRPLEERDAAIGLPVTVLGSVIATDLFGSAKDAIGELVDAGGGSMFRIVGVLEPIPDQVEEFQRLDVAALHPFSSALSTFGDDFRPADSQAYVRFEPGQQAVAAPSIRGAVARKIGRAHV